jgi:hypothetical protein
MDTDKIIELLFSILPAIVVGAVAFYFFQQHIENEEKRRRYLLQRDMQKEALPVRLQAYERMALFLERIAPSKLLVRTHPISSNKDAYESLLISNIEQEFEHNLSQQIYLSQPAWEVIKSAKENTIKIINSSMDEIKQDSPSIELSKAISVSPTVSGWSILNCFLNSFIIVFFVNILNFLYVRYFISI